MSVENAILNRMITHNFYINSIEEVKEDKSVLKFKAVVLDFEQSHNKWAVSEDTARKYMKTLLHKHIVTRYYSEDENDGIDALGDHEPSSTHLRGSNGDVEIPITNTRSIGTITNVWIAPLDPNNSLSKNVMWCEGILLAWDNLNECSLLLEWAGNNIPILTSVEWYYTQNMIDNDGVEWIVDPNFSALTILNSEQRGNKDIVYGNYDCSHIKLMLNNDHYQQFNSAVMEDIKNGSTKQEEIKKINGKGDEHMENRFLKAFNDISFGQIRSKIYEALSKVMIAEEYNTMYIGMWDIYDTYIIYETYLEYEWVRYKIDYTKSENDEITVDYASRKKVERQDVYVEVSEVQTATNSLTKEKEDIELKLNEVNETVETLKNDLTTSKDTEIVLNSTIVELTSKVEDLEKCKNELDEIKYNEKLEETKATYFTEFNSFNSAEKFETEEVQELIKDTLDNEKSFNSVIKLKDILLECAKTVVPVKENSKDGNSGVEYSKSLNSAIPKGKSKSYVDEYGFDING